MLPQLASTSQVTSSIAPPSTLAAAAAAAAAAPDSTTAPIPIATTTTTTTTTTTPAAPTSSATPAPGPAARTGASALKRPAPSDLQRIAGTSATPSKRRATGSGNYGVRSIPNPTSTSAGDPGRIEGSAPPHPQLLFQPSPAMMPAPATAVSLTEDQLHGRTPEQLIATILQLQSQHQQFVAQINAQYESINQQLNDLRGSLLASHQAAASVRSRPCWLAFRNWMSPLTIRFAAGPRCKRPTRAIRCTATSRAPATNRRPSTSTTTHADAHARHPARTSRLAKPSHCSPIYCVYVDADSRRPPAVRVSNCRHGGGSMEGVPRRDGWAARYREIRCHMGFEMAARASRSNLVLEEEGDLGQNQGAHGRGHGRRGCSTRSRAASRWRDYQQIDSHATG